jgi:hypothetical protein
MSVDFDSSIIRWFADDLEIGSINFPLQFRHSSLYFILGMRDEGTSVLLLHE